MSPPTAASVNGLVVVDKEAGWTSHDVVARCRRIFGQRRVGHAGTLDPDATGVLLVGLGRATRLHALPHRAPQDLRGEVVLGTATSTLDASGEVTGTWDMAEVTLAEVAGGGGRPDRATIEQVPPMVSAVKVGGPAAPRAGPRGDRGGAGPPGRSPCYRFDVAADRDDPGVFRHRGGVLVGDLRAGRWPPTWGPPSGAAPTCATSAAPGSARSPTDDARLVDELTPAVVLTPAQACATWTRWCVPLDAQKPRRPGGCPSTGSPSGSSGDGPWGLVDDDQRPAGRLRGHRDRPHPARRGRGVGRLTARPAGTGREPAGGNLQAVEIVTGRAATAPPAGGYRRDHRRLRRRPPRAPGPAGASCRPGPGRAGLATVVVTFDRHPASVVRPESAPQLLCDLDQKLELLDVVPASTARWWSASTRTGPTRRPRTS